MPLPVAPLPLRIPSPTRAQPGPPQDRSQDRRRCPPTVGHALPLPASWGSGKDRGGESAEPGMIGTRLESNGLLPISLPQSAQRYWAFSVENREGYEGRQSYTLQH